MKPVTFTETVCVCPVESPMSTSLLSKTFKRLYWYYGAVNSWNLYLVATGCESRMSHCCFFVRIQLLQDSCMQQWYAILFYCRLWALLRCIFQNWPFIWLIALHPVCQIWGTIKEFKLFVPFECTPKLPQTIYIRPWNHNIEDLIDTCRSHPAG